MNEVRRGRRSAQLLLIAVWAVCTSMWISPGITRPDGVGYFVYLPSTYLDGDLLFFDEWQRFGMIRDGVILHKEVTGEGQLANHWTVGSAILWYPGFLLGDAFRAMLVRISRFPRDGISLPYNVGVIVVSALSGLLTLLVGFRLAAARYGNAVALLVSLGIWFGTPLMWYSLRNPIMAHAPSALICALLLVLSIRLRNSFSGSSMFAAGLAAGFAFSVRPQNAAFAAIPFFFVPVDDLRTLARRSVPYLAGCLIGAMPQLVTTVALYGNPAAFFTGGGASKPFAAFERVRLWEPLLSWYHGLIPWSPILAFAVAGLWFLWKDDRRLAGACLYGIGAQWLINATLERSFWGAYAFGQRRFLNCSVLFLLAAAALFSRMPRWLAWLAAGSSSLWTMSIFIAAFERLDLNRYDPPVDLLRKQLAGLGDLPAHLGLLVLVPPPARRYVLLVVVLSGAVLFATALIVALCLRRRPLRMVAASATFLLAMSGLLIVWGWRGRVRAAGYADLIEFNQKLSRSIGGSDSRLGLLSYELDYLRRSGRSGEAIRTERDLRDLMAKRREGLREFGSRMGRDRDAGRGSR